MNRALHGVCKIFGGLLFILNDHENTHGAGKCTREASKKEKRQVLGYIINGISCCPYFVFSR